MLRHLSLRPEPLRRIVERPQRLVRGQSLHKQPVRLAQILRFIDDNHIPSGTGFLYHFGSMQIRLVPERRIVRIHSDAVLSAKLHRQLTDRAHADRITGHM